MDPSFNNASVASFGAAWRARAAELRQWVQRNRDCAAAGPDYSRRAAYVYLGLFIPAITLVVFSNWMWNAVVNDTLFLVASFDVLARFSSLFSNAIADPLEGLFDLFPSGLRLDMLPNLIGRRFFGPEMNVDFFYSFCAVLLAFVVASQARAVGLRWGVAVLAGILFPLLVLPFFGVLPLVEHFYILWPVDYYATVGAVLVTTLFWRIDGQSWWRAAALTALIIVILVHLSIIQIFFMTILAPAIAAMGVGALIAAKTRRDLLTKICCAVVVVIALASAGIFQYLYAIGLDAASHVFYQELIDFMSFSRPSLGLIVSDIGYVIFNPFTYDYTNTATIDGALAPLSQFGALYLAILGKTRETRIFGWSVLAWVVATGLTIAILHNFYFYTGLIDHGIIYQGPDPRHLVPVLWPYYAICLSALIFAVAERGVALLSRGWPQARRFSTYVPHGLVIFVLAVMVAFVAARSTIIALAPSFYHRFTDAELYFRDYHRTPVVDYLESQTAVGIDRDFRGSVVTMPTIYDKDTTPYAPWRRETTLAYARAALGNDLGMFGMQHYNIPTLDEETHNITPQFYLTVRELLSRPGVAYDKHYSLVTRVNEPIMALLGLRYIIADYEVPFGTQRLAVPLPEAAKNLLESRHLLKSPVRVYELPDPNVGNYSPTNVVRATTAAATIVAMSNPAFDGRRTVVTDDDSIADNLVRATGAAMTIRVGGVAVRASSAGQSVLVLPVQYSHCWQIASGSDATLFRANLTELGVRFSGDLQIELRQIFGPFWESSCKVADFADVERLRMVDAMGTNAMLSKVPGDGMNLIPSTDALGRVVGEGAVASPKPLGAGSSPLREYTLAADGRSSKHYIMLNAPNLAPGPYTLSLQVKANEAKRLTLQINDATNNGALANYLLPTHNVWVLKLGQGDDLNATIRKIDAEWLELTLTSTIAAGTGQVHVQLGSSRDWGLFRARGETATIRAVKLEHGELATPYSTAGQ